MQQHMAAAKRQPTNACSLLAAAVRRTPLVPPTPVRRLLVVMQLTCCVCSGIPANYVLRHMALPLISRRGDV